MQWLKHGNDHDKFYVAQIINTKNNKWMLLSNYWIQHSFSH